MEGCWESRICVACVDFAAVGQFGEVVAHPEVVLRFEVGECRSEVAELRLRLKKFESGTLDVIHRDVELGKCAHEAQQHYFNLVTMAQSYLSKEEVASIFMLRQET